MELEYIGPATKNIWAFLGMGTTAALVEKGDVSPYLNVENIDPDWMKATGIDASKIYEAKVKELQAQHEDQGDQSKEHMEKTSIT